MWQKLTREDLVLKRSSAPNILRPIPTQLQTDWVSTNGPLKNPCCVTVSAAITTPAKLRARFISLSACIFVYMDILNVCQNPAFQLKKTSFLPSFSLKRKISNKNAKIPKIKREEPSIEIKKYIIFKPSNNQ